MIPFVDLKAQHARIHADVLARIGRVLEGGAFILGPEVAELEQALAEFAGVPHVVACANGTDALTLLLMARGVGPGDAVLTTPFTFVATAEAAAVLGATPVFADIDPADFTLDAGALEQAIEAWSRHADPERPRLRGIISVDLFGLPADLERINAVAERHGLFHISDAAQSFGAGYRGRKAASVAPMTATSFFPSKPLGCYGDGGAMLVRDAELAARLKSLRAHGRGGHRYEHVCVGLNSRLDTVQAAVLLAKLAVFPDELERRRAVARAYDRLLAGIPGLVTPAVPGDRESAWAQYSVLTDRRDALAEALAGEGIPSAVYYPIPLHLQPAFAGLGHKPGDFPAAEACAARILSLPMHPYLDEAVQARIAEVVARVLAREEERAG